MPFDPKHVESYSGLVAFVPTSTGSGDAWAVYYAGNRPREQASQPLGAVLLDKHGAWVVGLTLGGNIFHTSSNWTSLEDAFRDAAKAVKRLFDRECVLNHARFVDPNA